MKIILLFLLFNTSAYALEFNQKAFKQSMKQYQEKVKQWSKNPKGIVDDLQQKYEPSLQEIKKGVSKIDLDFDAASIVKKQEDLLVYYNFLEGKFKRYTKMSTGEEFYRVFSNDVSNTFSWAYHNSDSVPLIGPYKKEILTKVKMLKVQMIPYESIIRAGLAH